jgi:hypothetical protein
VDTFIERTPQIIAEAAKNPLGLAALVVLVVSALSYLFFRNASQNAKLFIFIPMAASFILIVLVLADADKNRRFSWPDSPEPMPPAPRPPVPDVSLGTPARLTPHPSSIGGIGLGAWVEAVSAKLPVNTDAYGNKYARAPVKVTYGRGPNATVLDAWATYHFVGEQVREIETDIKLDQEQCGRSSRALHLANATDADWGISRRRRGFGCHRPSTYRSGEIPIKPAKGLFLHAPGNHSPQQVLAQTRRRRSSEDRPPAPPKGIKRKRAQARDLGFDRGRLYPLLPHGYALG